MSGAGVVVLVGIAMAVGVAGTVVPVVPGLSLVVAAAAVYGIVEGFGTAGVVAMVVIVALGAAGTVAGFVLPSRAAGGTGASRVSLLVGVVGAVIGAVLVPVVGFPLGGAVGIYVGERVRTSDGAAAWRSTMATLKGFGMAAVAQVGAGLTMVAVWIAWVVAG